LPPILEGKRSSGLKGGAKHLNKQGRGILRIGLAKGEEWQKGNFQKNATLYVKKGDSRGLMKFLGRLPETCVFHNCLSGGAAPDSSIKNARS